MGWLATAQGPRASAQDARTQFAIFAFLLAMAVLFHQSRLGDWQPLSHHTLVSLTAIAVLVRPSSLHRLLVMLVVQLVSVAIDAPSVVNHWLLLALTTLGLGIALAAAAIRRRPWLSDTGEVFRRIAPVIRIQVVAVYLFAVLAKLNTDFLDPALSCAALMSEDLLNKGPLGLHAAWQDGPAIAGTLLVEALLPIGLLVRRTRLVAVMVGAGFHTVLAVAGHVPFSGFAFAFYALFLPDDVPERLRHLLRDVPALRTLAAWAQGFAHSPLALPLLGGAWVAVAAGVTHGPQAFATAVERSAVVAFVAYAAALGALVMLLLRRGGPGTYGPGTLRLAGPLWAIAPVLVLLNAATPYLGLKTQSAFTMYSNLQTEPGRWNHALLPESIRRFDLQDDRVTVLRSSDERLAALARDRTELIEHDFRTYVTERPGISVTYRQAGRVTTAAGDTGLSRPALLERKLLLFRDVPVQERNSCRNRRPGGPAQGS